MCRFERGQSTTVAPASRDDAKGRFVTGDAVGFVREEIVAWGGTGSTLSPSMARLAEGAEILTVIAGEGAPIALTELEGLAPEGVELELHEGGQPALPDPAGCELRAQVAEDVCRLARVGLEQAQQRRVLDATEYSARRAVRRSFRAAAGDRSGACAARPRRAVHARHPVTAA